MKYHVSTILLALVLLPAASAQAPASGLELSTSTEAPYLDPGGTTQIPVNVTIGCVLILQGLEQSSISVSAAVPEWIAVTDAVIPVSIADCAGDEDAIITKSGTVDLTPSPTAPGLTPFTVALQAAFNDAGGSTTTADSTVEGLAVDYSPGHTLDPAGDQTFQVEGGSHAFEVQLDIQANARTMVMFENRVVSGGTLNGLTHKIFEVPDGDTSATYSLTWTAPEGPWTEETVTFYNYSHCLDREGCTPNDEANPTWTFVNAAPAEHHAEDEDASTPGPGAPMLMLALAAIALARRR